MVEVTTESQSRPLSLLITMASPDQFRSGAKPLACPYFMPIEKLENGNWPHPARLPLGGGWRGHCTAPGHEGEVPEQHVQEAFCNLGYADGCAWSPKEREWDAIRFAVLAGRSDTGETGRKAQPLDRIVHLRYVCERNHCPSADGVLEFDCVSATWVEPHPNPRLRKMAECFLHGWMAKHS
jgi:hypothetical protein